MTVQIAAYGRLGGDPVERQSQAGKTWATATIAVDVDREPDAAPMWLGIVAFGKQAETLCRHYKGDLLSVSGQLQRNSWTDQNGERREKLQVVADAIVSARAVRPSNGGRKRSDSEKGAVPADQPEEGGRPYEDDIPFAPEVR